MIERREFISICRQIGTMMEVGVDFLRITGALRAQTDNARLLALYDQLDDDLRAGDSLSDAMSHAPDVFSPFAVSLVRQGEARGDIEGAWARIADFYKVEAREDIELGDEAGALEPIGARFRGQNAALSRRIGPGMGYEPLALGRIALGLATLLGLLAGVRALVEVGAWPSRFESLGELGVAALFFLVVGARQGRAQRAEEAQARCAFCRREAGADVLLSFAPDAGGNGTVAICSECAGQIVTESPRSRAQRDDEERERNRILRGVADALPQDDGAALDDTIILADDDPLAPSSPVR